MRPPRPGDVVCVTFWDHHEDSDTAYLYRVFGRVYRTTPRELVVDCWADPPKPVLRALGAEDQGRSSRGSDNLKTYTIVRKAIEHVALLTPTEELQP